MFEAAALGLRSNEATARQIGGGLSVASFAFTVFTVVATLPLLSS